MLNQHVPVACCHVMSTIICRRNVTWPLLCCCTDVRQHQARQEADEPRKDRAGKSGTTAAANERCQRHTLLLEHSSSCDPQNTAAVVSSSGGGGSQHTHARRHDKTPRFCTRIPRIYLQQEEKKFEKILFFEQQSARHLPVPQIPNPKRGVTLTQHATEPQKNRVTARLPAAMNQTAVATVRVATPEKKQQEAKQEPAKS